MLTGDNGILTQAQNAKTTSERAETIEKAKLDVLEIQVENEGKITETQLNEILAKYGTISGEGEDKVITTDSGHIIKVSEIYNGKSTSGGSVTPIPFDPETLTIGTAINSEKYGWKVTNYTEKTDVTGCWRLFYQDNNYTYIISDNFVEWIQPGLPYTDYIDGSYVSTIGQRLNPMLLEAGTFFVDSNKDKNIRATAWLTDTSDTGMWAEYKNEDAVFAIGSPTVELYKASFNATASGNGANEITLGTGTHGYTHDTTGGQLSVNYNKGIYNKSTSSDWWIASPEYSEFDTNLYVTGESGRFLEGLVGDAFMSFRPIVCIQTSVFNSNYKLVNK